MAKMRTILRRMRSISGIRTVTRAMQTVSAARFKMAYDHIQTFTPFAVELLELVRRMAERRGALSLRHPLLTAPEGIRRDVLLVLTSDRGLCGSYNSGVLRLGAQRREQLQEAGYEVLLHVVGARGARYLGFRGTPVEKVHEGLGDGPDFARAAALADEMMADFLDGLIGGLEVAYMQFVSAGRQRPVIAQVLPVAELPARAEGAREEAELAVPYDLYPDGERILRRLLPVTVRLKLYQCFLDAAASEQFMRRTAMQAATENADEMAQDLKVRANRLRQREITTELAEIMGGQTGRRGA